MQRNVLRRNNLRRSLRNPSVNLYLWGLASQAPSSLLGRVGYTAWPFNHIVEAVRMSNRRKKSQLLCPCNSGKPFKNCCMMNVPIFESYYVPTLEMPFAMHVGFQIPTSTNNVDFAPLTCVGSTLESVNFARTARNCRQISFFVLVYATRKTNLLCRFEQQRVSTNSFPTMY